MMRADVRAGLRELKERMDQDASNDEAQGPVIFRGPVHSVIVVRQVSADTVQIIGGRDMAQEPAG